MFGLMRAKKCGMSAAEKHFRRLNYCGTCKTIGSLYGQKSRLLLNYDTVFLAEILTALSGENVEHWQNSYQSYNCLNLPKNEIPSSLRFAATTNIILTKFKLADHISDEKQLRYPFANKAFSREFKLAEKLLKNWDFPLDEVEKILRKQENIESNSKSLDDFAKPTAETTAIFFREGVRIIEKDDLQNLAYKFGFAFGKLIYLLDAFEDYEKDFRNGKFNAFRAALGLNTSKFSNKTKRKIKIIINALEMEIIGYIYQLPISESQKVIFSSRLTENLQKKIKTNLPVLKAKKVCVAKPKITFTERWKNAFQTAKIFAGNYSWQVPFVFLFILTFALIAPAQSREAKSARECLDLSFNLMFLGGILSSVFALKKPLLSQDPGRIYPDVQKNKPPQNQLQDDGSWCDYFDLCDCCDCDCCCECDCCCDGCDCCTCDC